SAPAPGATALLLDRDRQRVLLGSPVALASLYTRLVFLDGGGSHHFHKVREHTGIGGQRGPTGAIERGGGGGCGGPVTAHVGGTPGGGARGCAPGEAEGAGGGRKRGGGGGPAPAINQRGRQFHPPKRGGPAPRLRLCDTSASSAVKKTAVIDLGSETDPPLA